MAIVATPPVSYMLYYSLVNAVRYRLNSYLRLIKTIPDKIILLGARGLYRVFPSNSSLVYDSLYPPKRLCRSTRNWMTMLGTQIGAKYIEVDSGRTVQTSLPKTPDRFIRQQISMDVNYDWPSTFVVNIPGGRTWGPGYIVTPDGQLLDDVSVDFRAERWTLSPKPSSIVRYWRWQNVAEYDGRVAVLSTDGADIYYHWFFQLLPRFELIRRSGIDLDSIDYFVVNDLTKSFQKDSIRALGIDYGKIIESSKVPYLRARELIVPSIPLGGGCYWPWMCQFLRSTFLQNSPASVTPAMGRRVYISRGIAAYRRVLNESDVINLLKSHGFEEIKFEGLAMSQQAASMASCEAVIAPHGAGLSNIVFCTPGTKIIEIFSPELVNGLYWKLANQLDLDYYYIVGDGPPHTLEQNYQQSWNAVADITVDLSKLRQALELANLT